ncbi:MAG: PPC domain-containing protein [Sandaracinaceae bacterium]|nr:PPC domain-containing protein [Sandaracinaceae bacterium]
MTPRRILPLLLALSSTLVAACAGEAPSAFDEAAAETGLDQPAEAVPEEGKADGVEALGPTIGNGAATEVWAVRNQWTDTTTAEARLAGVAWSANSGLDWEQKYERWVGSLEVIPRAGYGQTVRIRTPFGTRTFDSPTLECAEFGMFLRATFASWYGLPFFLTGWDATGRQTMFAGHFGFVNRRGETIARFPAFRTAYTDYTSRWREGQAWPSDSRLRGLRLGTDDAVQFLSTDGTTRGAGAYFDEMFLNKRVGYFMRLLLLYFGSVNLADSANMYHASPESLRAGDLLLHRWQRQGIGHVIPVLRRTNVDDTHFEVAVASGSMPRRQPLWEEGSSAREEFLSDDAGGPGTAWDGSVYATLGGGLRRWRTPVLSSGRWRNQIRTTDRTNALADGDTAAIGARLARFEELLAQVSPEMRRDAAIERITNARTHLSMYPASCSARTRREDAFADLYSVMSEYFGTDRAEVDARYRTLADRVFAELTYEEARTCCWNSSTAAMQSIVVQYAEREQADAAARSMCVEPTIFRAEASDLMAGGDGYGRWRTFATSIGRGAEWRAWSEDETCAGRAVVGDHSTGRGLETAFCSATGPVASDCDPAGGNDTTARATTLATGTPINARICTGDVDVYRVEAGTSTATVILSFRHSAGDLDLQAVREDGTVITESAGTSDEERVSATGTFFVRVIGYSNAQNSYTIRR